MANTQIKYNTAHLDEADLKRLIQLIKGKVDGLNATDNDLLCALKKLKKEVDEIWLDKETGVKDLTYDEATNTLTFELANGKKTDIQLNNFTDLNVVQEKITVGERRLLLTSAESGSDSVTATTAYADGVSFDVDNNTLKADNITVSGNIVVIPGPKEGGQKSGLVAPHVESEDIDHMFQGPNSLEDKLKDFNVLECVEVKGDEGCEVYGGGIYRGKTETESGETVVVAAIAKPGYRFVEWSNGEKEQEFAFEVKESTGLTATTEVNPDARITRQANIQTYDLNGVRHMNTQNFVFSSNDEGRIKAELYTGGIILQIDKTNYIVNPTYQVPFEDLPKISDKEPALTFTGDRFDFNVEEHGVYNLSLELRDNTWVLTKL